MNTRYGNLPEAEFTLYKKRMHSLIHWLLVYADEGNPCLEGYFQKVQVKLVGFSSLLNQPPLMMDLMVLVESARILQESPDFDRRLYKKMILDAHEVIERIFAYGE